MTYSNKIIIYTQMYTLHVFNFPFKTIGLQFIIRHCIRKFCIFVIMSNSLCLSLNIWFLGILRQLDHWLPSLVCYQILLEQSVQLQILRFLTPTNFTGTNLEVQTTLTVYIIHHHLHIKIAPPPIECITEWKHKLSSPIVCMFRVVLEMSLKCDLKQIKYSFAHLSKFY